MTQKQLKPGDILLFKGSDTLVEKLIQHGTKSPYSHAGVYLGEGKTAEAFVRGFVEVNRGTEMLTNPDKVHIYRSNYTIHPTLLKSSVEEYYGTSYGFLDILRIGIYILSGKKIWSRRTKNLICSEAVAQIYRDLGHDLYPNKVLDWVTPAMLSQHKQLKRIYLKR